jgi:ADP-heptose:LPS heptosyltransferase
MFRITPFLYTHHLANTQGLSDMEINLKMLELAGFSFIARDIEKTQPTISLTAEDKDWSRRWLLEEGISEHDFLIGLHPGCGRLQKWKRWPQEKFILLVKELNKQFSSRCIFFGGEEDRDLLKIIYSQVTDNASVFISNNVQLTAALIGQCKLFISNDSFLKLVSVAMQIPTVGIFGPTDPVRTRPQTEIMYSEVKKGLVCQPCFKFQRKFQCNSLDCLETIGVDDVLKEAKKYSSVETAALKGEELKIGL